jgi:hypothetical protein
VLSTIQRLIHAKQTAGTFLARKPHSFSCHDRQCRTLYRIVRNCVGDHELFPEYRIHRRHQLGGCCTGYRGSLDRYSYWSVRRDPCGDRIQLLRQQDSPYQPGPRCCGQRIHEHGSKELSVDGVSERQSFRRWTSSLFLRSTSPLLWMLMLGFADHFHGDGTDDAARR